MNLIMNLPRRNQARIAFEMLRRSERLAEYNSKRIQDALPRSLLHEHKFARFDSSRSCSTLPFPQSVRCSPDLCAFHLNHTRACQILLRSPDAYIHLNHDQVTCKHMTVTIALHLLPCVTLHAGIAMATDSYARLPLMAWLNAFM
jgi:hypothetical protein